MEANIFQQISDIITTWFPIITSAIGTFALIAAATPTKTDDKILQVLSDVVHFLGANFGKAKNKKDQ